MILASPDGRKLIRRQSSGYLDPSIESHLQSIQLVDNRYPFLDADHLLQVLLINRAIAVRLADVRLRCK